MILEYVRGMLVRSLLIDMKQGRVEYCESNQREALMFSHEERYISGGRDFGGVPVIKTPLQ